MDSTPSRRLRQNCSRVLAPGKRPAIPIIAMLRLSMLLKGDSPGEIDIAANQTSVGAAFFSSLPSLLQQVLPAFFDALAGLKLIASGHALPAGGNALGE